MPTTGTSDTNRHAKFFADGPVQFASQARKGTESRETRQDNRHQELATSRHWIDTFKSLAEVPNRRSRN